MSVDPLDILIGKRLRQRRKDLNVSAARLGAVFDISYQQICKYESGQNRVPASRLYGFARELAVPLVWFFEGDEPPKLR